MSRNFIAAVGCVASCMIACSSNDGNETDVGQVTLEVTTAPSDVRCVVVQVVGSTRTVKTNIDVTPGQSIYAPINGLPTGSVTVSALAYASACSAVTSSSAPNWVGDPATQTITLTKGVTVPLNIVLRPNGGMAPKIEWQDDTVGGAGGSGGSTSTGGTGGTTVSTPAGWWTAWKTEGWHGCPWTGTDPGSSTTITPKDFLTTANGGPYRVNGTLAASSTYASYAVLGFNLGQDPAGASCAYDVANVSRTGLPAVSMPFGATGIAFNFAKSGTATLRIQMQGPNGATDANDRWCQTISLAGGSAFAKFTDFYPSCWNSDPTTRGTAYGGQPIAAITFLAVSSSTSGNTFDFTINGFAAGTSAADAPGGSTGPITGTIGGSGTADLDSQKVKVAVSGKEYIIQNNNFGNPSGSDQTLSYSDNTFKIVSSTGTGTSSPASYPSIYIGNNGSTNNGMTTKATDGLPKQISSATSIQTTLNWTGTCSSGFNTAYDVWFSASAPTASYNDMSAGEVMVWLCKPSDHNPIGSQQRTATIGGRTWNVWVGPRGGSGSNASAPVVSYVAQSAVNSLTFDLLPFVKDAATNGILSSWYVTDVFGGFQIWNGSSATGLVVSSFTCAVQ